MVFSASARRARGVNSLLIVFMPTKYDINIVSELFNALTTSEVSFTYDDFPMWFTSEDVPYFTCIILDGVERFNMVCYMSKNKNKGEAGHCMEGKKDHQK